MSNHVTSGFFGSGSIDGVLSGIQQAINALGVQDGIYTGDNLFTYHKNLSFLDDVDFMTAARRHITTPIEEAILWRTSVIAWGAGNGVRLAEGDLVECACYKGTTARIVFDYLNLSEKSDRKYYLYDLFDHDPLMPHHTMLEHSNSLYAEVKARFSDAPNVIVTQGKVPDILGEVAPDKIAFLHLDLNNADAEVGALEVLFDRMVPGAVMILDDYGWLVYRAQKLALDPWFAKRGYRVLELPTGQGLLIK
jgi:hypothetical protein